MSILVLRLANTVPVQSMAKLSQLLLCGDRGSKCNAVRIGCAAELVASDRKDAAYITATTAAAAAAAAASPPGESIDNKTRRRRPEVCGRRNLYLRSADPLQKKRRHQPCIFQ